MQSLPRFVSRVKVSSDQSTDVFACVLIQTLVADLTLYMVLQSPTDLYLNANGWHQTALSFS